LSLNEKNDELLDFINKIEKEVSYGQLFYEKRLKEY